MARSPQSHRGSLRCRPRRARRPRTCAAGVVVARAARAAAVTARPRRTKGRRNGGAPQMSTRCEDGGQRSPRMILITTSTEWPLSSIACHCWPIDLAAACLPLVATARHSTPPPTSAQHGRLPPSSGTHGGHVHPQMGRRAHRTRRGAVGTPRHALSELSLPGRDGGRAPAALHLQARPPYRLLDASHLASSPHHRLLLASSSPPNRLIAASSPPYDLLIATHRLLLLSSSPPHSAGMTSRSTRRTRAACR